MKKKELIIGKTYLISHPDWSGKATLTKFNPVHYNIGTIEFLCNDGELGVFLPENVIMEVSSLSMFTDEELREELEARGYEVWY